MEGQEARLGSTSRRRDAGGRGRSRNGEGARGGGRGIGQGARRLAGIAGLALALAFTTAAQAQTQTERALETRVQNLEITVKALTEELKAARQAAKDAADKAAASAAAPAPGVARSGKKNVTLTVSGQVNRGVLVADDGHDTEIFHVDNDHSSTRLSFHGAGRVNEELEVGAEIEVQIESNSTASVSQIDKSTPDQSFSERVIEVYADHERFGKLSIGQGSTASDGSSELDLTGTNLIVKSAQSEFAGGLVWREDSPPSVGSPNQTILLASRAQDRIRDTHDNFDGLSRRDRARYDTPSFYGFTLSGSAASEGAYDGAIRYKGKHGPMRVVGAFAAANDPEGGNERNQFSGSGSVLHEPTGLALTFAAGCRDGFAKDRGCADRRFWYVKGGWQWDIFDFGRTFFGVDYYSGRGIDRAGDRSTSIGGGVVQAIDGIATELYLGIRNYSLARAPAGAAVDSEFSDIFAVLTGARVKF